MRKKLLLFAFLLVCAAFGVQGQTVSGTITDEKDGSPMPGVNIVVKGTTTGTTSDLDGNYSISASSDDVLVYTFLGYTRLEIKVGNRSSYNVSMTEDAEQLQEVVVTALGISREKKSLGYTVTEVQGDALATVKETNVINSLSGKVAGVVITQASGGPAASSRVVIRGNSSLTGNNQPLYVVDGIPIDNSAFGSTGGGGTGEFNRTDYGSGISDLNPDDIETMSVLKGPNAAALYGSRASNGVILITTKKGRAGKGVGVTYTTNMQWDTPLVLPKFQNEYGQGNNGAVGATLDDLLQQSQSWGGRLDGSQQQYYTGETRPYVAQPNNVEDFFRTGWTWVNTLTFEGGDADKNVRLSYTNMQNKSIIPNADMNRHNINLRGFAKLGKRLTIDSKITYFVQDAENRPWLGSTADNPISPLFVMPRNIALSDMRMYQNPDLSVRSWANGQSNMYWAQFENTNDDRRQRVQGFMKATLEITDWLSIFGRVGSDFVDQSITQIFPTGHVFYPTGRRSDQTPRTNETNADFLLMFDKTWSEKFHLNFNFGGNHSYRRFEALNTRGENFKIPTNNAYDNVEDRFISHTPPREKIVNSLYFSGSFGYDDWLYFDFSGRGDWSSSLYSYDRGNTEAYYYPSTSLALLFNEMLDMSDNVLSFSKLRFSWSRVGNDTDPYRTQDNIYFSDADGYRGTTSIRRPSTRNNPDLKEETSDAFEIGAELKFFNNRLYLDANYYNIRTFDQIMPVPVAATTGYNFFLENVGEIRNEGFELLIGGTPINNPNFRWDMSLNMARNRNWLIDLIEGTDRFVFSNLNTGGVTVEARVGENYGNIYGPDYSYTDDGQIILGENGLPIRSSEPVLLGNYQPDLTGGFSNSFFYKGFTLNLLVDFRFGGEAYSFTERTLDASGVSVNSLEHRDGVVIDGVINTGTAETPVYVPNTVEVTGQQFWGNHSGIASNYIKDLTNIRLREMSLTYNMPARWFGPNGIKKLSVGFVGRNLFFFHKEIDSADPEASYSVSNNGQGILYLNMPSTRSYGFNLSLGL